MAAQVEPVAANPQRLSFTQVFRAQRDPLTFFGQLARAPGDFSHLVFGKRSLVLLKNPDLIRQILVTDHESVEKGRTTERGTFFQFLGNGLLNSQGREHKRQRRLMLPAFHHSRLEQYSRAMVDCTAKMMTSWQEDSLVDIAAETSKLTLSITANTLFSSDMAATTEAIAAAFNQLSLDINKLAFPGASYVMRTPLPFARRIRRAQSQLDDIVNGLIRERRKTETDTGDLLSMLLLARDADNPSEQLSETEVRDQVMTLFFAGHETAMNALTWTFWLLAKHQDIQARLLDEISTLGDQPLGFSNVRALPFAEKIIRESLRLYPPVWALARKAVEDLSLNGYVVPRNSLVFASPWVIHRDPKLFPDPEAYLPDRWTPEFQTKLHRFAYFPFGGGGRSCIGENFAWMEFILVVCSVVQKWHLHDVETRKPVLPVGRVTLHPNQSIRLRVQRR